ncbi:MAG: polysaccharide deacetylase family protein [Chloroflexi bacterium]|nr:polysaccharide deacetylase family protein [Chloroflexota bacterium]
MSGEKLLGTIQVDVDDLWVYYESIGRQTPEGARPVAFEQGIPRLLALFDRYGIRATFFVCGRDAAAQGETIRELIRRGHEVANHSLAHRNGFARLSPAEKITDIATAGEQISQVTGERPVGFKAPGFSFSPDLPGVLAELGYLYDSSLLPTFYAPVMRLAQRLLSGGHVDPTHYGSARNGFAPLSPFRISDFGFRIWNRRSTASNLQSVIRNPQLLWEAPVTTVPLFRLPMHSTFVLSAGRWLFDLGLTLAKARRVPINYLLHAADVVDTVPDPALASYKFLAQPWAAKRPLYEHMLGKLSAAYRLVPTADLIEQADKLDGA